VTATLFRGGRVLRLPAAIHADWLLIEDAEVVATGRDGDQPDADRIVELDGGTLIPAFCDAHVHLPATGLYASGMDFRGERSADRILAAFAERSRAQQDVLFGGNFEDPLDRPLSRTDLDEVVGGSPALLARADMHSCIVSTELLRRLDVVGLEGVDRDESGEPTGYLRERAASEAWAWFDRSLTALQQRDAVRSAVRLAYSKGISHVHEMFVVEWRGWDAWDVFSRAIEEVALGVVPYLGTDEVERVANLGLGQIGGDFFLDGSFGSHTAWLSEAYAVRPPEGTPEHGISYRTDGDLYAFFSEAQHAGLQTGVHAIGDAAIDQALTAWQRVAKEVGSEQVRRLGHRIEHFECASDDHIRRAAALGLRASVQPAFDRFWGGEDGLYARRMGWERARLMNRFGTMLEGGLWLGAGSDSTVTPMDPFLQLASLGQHHLEEERLGRTQSLRLHTMGARRLGPAPELAGSLEPGAPADLAILDRDPIDVDPDELLKTEVLGTWVGGRRVWPEDSAEAL
jgi:predicted amidohydrolase YtcJ